MKARFWRISELEIDERGRALLGGGEKGKGEGREQRGLGNGGEPGEARHGSWDPDCAWGGVGGRVYSTAMVALCLEVYHRYPRLVP